ncbi:MAG: hypothetical protein CMP39_03925 [Rickettsiales bacterium]|nr:hypothetical protein [Rickettsiales bacterium]|tara:strand:+ start:7817 stop:9508 length:1692 start_codon:yes stop_codon:yes gene_type:complete
MNINKYLLLIFLCLLSFNTTANKLHLNKVIYKIQIKGDFENKILNDIDLLDLNSNEGQRLNKESVNKDIQKLMTTGYFEKVIAYSDKINNKVNLIYECNPNPIVKNIVIKGNTVFKQNKLLNTFKQKKDHIVNFKNIKKDKNKLLKKYKELGYNFIKINSITFDKETETLIYEINEGTISAINFIGLNKIKEKILLRELSSKKGTVFNSNTIRIDREKLLTLGYFTFVSSPKLDIDSQSQIKITFKLSEKKVNRVDFGIEHEDNIVAGFVNNIRNHNIIHSDLLSVKTQINFENNTLLFNNYKLIYRQPWTLNKSKLSTSGSIYSEEHIENINNEQYLSNRSGLNLRFLYPLSKTLKASILLKNETVEPLDAAASTEFETYNLNSLSLKLNYSNIKNRINPKKGRYFTIEFEQGDDLKIIQLGGLSFSKTILNIANFFKVSKKATVATRFQAGFFDPNEGSTFETENFILGGATNLRGYSESKFTGEKKALANFEYRYELNETFQPILFYDIGNAFDSTIENNPLKSSYGIGLRIITPVIPIRFDFAINPNQTFFHFGFGQIF